MINEQLIKKWTKTGLLHGIEDDLRKQFVARNLEDAANWLVRFANNTDKKIENTEQLTGTLLPAICRISREETFDVSIDWLFNTFIEKFSDIDLPPEYFEGKSLKCHEHLTDIYTVLLKRIIIVDGYKYGT